MEITFTKEDIELVEKFIEIKNRGMYCNSAELTNAYNRILHKSVNNTSCGSCLRQRTQELEDALNRFKRLSDASKQEEVNNAPQETKPVKTKRKK